MLEDTQNIDPLAMAAHASFDTGDVLSILIICCLLVGSAMMSSSESAFFSLSPQDRLQLRQDDSKAAATALHLLSYPQRLLATILIANNFVNVGVIIISTNLLSPWLEMIDSPIISSLIEVVLITFILLLVGEVIPKIYGAKNSLRTAKGMARILNLLSNIPPISWLVTILVNGTNFIHKYAGKKGFNISSDELEAALALTMDDNATDEEQKILEGIVKFGSTDVKQIMCPRLQVISINYECNFEEAFNTVIESGYSRIPVYEGNLDNVKGILFSKDLLPYLTEKHDFEWQKLLRQAIFVPENKKDDDLLKEIQKKKVHMAIVVDEYGGVSGVVTFEDVLEEIVGEITDEFDDVEIVYTKIDDNTFLFEGKTALVDFYKVLDIEGKNFEAKKGDAETLGGFITENAGRILKNNEFITFENIKMVVESSDKKRIKMVKTIRLDA